MYIGIDDTDSKNGSCTTYVMTRVIEEILQVGDIIGFPRLVRLNPNIPWKTRGNGALSLKVGIGYGKKFLIGTISDEPVYAYERILRDLPKQRIFDTVANIVERESMFDDPTTNPGFVVASRKLPLWLYWNTVRRITDIETVRALLIKEDALFREYKNGRGIIGSSAAIAWRSFKKTYELLSYRDKSRWSTRTRNVNITDVKSVELGLKEAFNSYDLYNDHSCISPHTLCPILYGVRATSFAPLYSVPSEIKGEQISRWFLYETNQGTDDHMISADINHTFPYGSFKIKVIVDALPEIRKGGDTFVRVRDKTGMLTAAFYNESSPMTIYARKLMPGDTVVLYGSIRNKGDIKEKTLNIEKFIVQHVAVHMEKENPRCPVCRKHMKSAGRGQGFRCKKCSTKSPDAEMIPVPRDLMLGIYEPPPSRMRHLAMPAKIMNRILSS